MATQLKEGQKAPAFTGTDQDGNKISLADFKGQKVVLYFYPEDDTPTCTIQACNLRDNYGLLQQHGFKVIGVSPDEETKHQKFREKFGLPFTLLADPKHKIIDKYGVWGDKNLYGRKYMGIHRTTFVINEKGMIKKYFFGQRMQRMHRKSCQQDKANSMCRLLLYISSMFLFLSCSKSNNSTELTGKWKRVEQYVNPGSGGSWKETKDIPPVVLELTEEGNVRSNHYVYSTYKRYQKVGRDSIEFTDASGQKRYHSYLFQEGKLTIQFLCIEGCGDRFVRY